MRKSEGMDLDGVVGHGPLHAFRNLQPDYYSESIEELFTTETPKPDDTPTDYISESGTTFRVLPVQLGKTGLTRHIEDAVDFLRLEERPEKIILGNPDMPAFEERRRFEAFLQDDWQKVIVVTGPTGSGKSTQFPQFSVNAGYEAAKITQPRRPAADNVGIRIEAEILQATENAVDAPQVAIRTGGKHEGPNDAAITITTEGYLLTSWQRLEEDARSGKKIVLLLDEAHESSSDFEMLAVLVKKFLKENPDSNLKVVVMSATLDAGFYVDYFDDPSFERPKTIDVKGRMFDVTKYERPNSTVSKEAVLAANDIANKPTDGGENGIWVFVPGKREIKDVIDEIRASLSPQMTKITTILPFHAKLTEDKQRAVFVHYPGVKIIVSTNAGETSVTDPDCRYVIDSGLARQMLLDEEQILGLERYHISQDECTQRAGRTGRVCPGTHILTRLDDREDFIPFIYRDLSPVPEILRTDIVRHVLRTASFGYDINLLTEVPHPISQEVLDKAKETLRILGAFDADYQLTPLGKRMNMFPASANTARMMAEADRYNEITRAHMSAIVACVEAGKLQLYAPDVERRWESLIEERTSDLLAQLDIFIALQDMSEEQMRDFDIDINNYNRALEQYKKIARQAHTFGHKLLPPNQEEKENIITCILAGSLQSVYVHSGGGKYRHTGNQINKREISHRSVVNHSYPRAVVGDPYRAEYWRDGERREKHILENVTATTLLKIGSAAVHLSEWHDEELLLRDNKVVARRGQYLFGEPLGISEEASARPSAESQAFLFNWALKNPGSAQKKLRKIKTELEQLSRRSGKRIEGLGQAEFETLLLRAIPEDLVDASQIDNNLRMIIDELSISLDSFVSPGQRADIYRNAPTELVICGEQFRVTYKSTGPEIRLHSEHDLEVIVSCQEDTVLPDGRMVSFVYSGKKYNLHRLQELFN